MLFSFEKVEKESLANAHAPGAQRGDVARRFHLRPSAAFVQIGSTEWFCQGHGYSVGRSALARPVDLADIEHLKRLQAAPHPKQR
jgi:hypothetical protein